MSFAFSWLPLSFLKHQKLQYRHCFFIVTICNLTTMITSSVLCLSGTLVRFNLCLNGVGVGVGTGATVGRGISCCCCWSGSGDGLGVDGKSGGRRGSKGAAVGVGVNFSNGDSSMGLLSVLFCDGHTERLAADNVCRRTQRTARLFIVEFLWFVPQSAVSCSFIYATMLTLSTMITTVEVTNYYYLFK